MRLQVDQLLPALQKKLAPVYFFSGDEPLQLGEAADAVRTAAKQQDYLNREVYAVDSGFSWQAWIEEIASASIFSERKLVELAIPNAKPGTDGAKVLTQYCQKLPVDTILLITAGKLPSSAKRSKWVQTLEQTGVLLQVWPLQGADLLQWLQRRLHQKGMQADREAIRLLAQRIEGNLLAAVQEIEKMFVLYGPVKISTDQVLQAVQDSSRYDVFELVDSVLAGNVARSLKILQVLQAEGIVDVVVLWALTREIRTLEHLRLGFKRGENRQQLFRQLQIWDKRQSLVQSALKRLPPQTLQQMLLLAGRVDRQIKCGEQGDSWQSLMLLCLLFCGQPVMAETG